MTHDSSDHACSCVLALQRQISSRVVLQATAQKVCRPRAFLNARCVAVYTASVKHPTYFTATSTCSATFTRPTVTRNNAANFYVSSAFTAPAPIRTKGLKQAWVFRLVLAPFNLRLQLSHTHTFKTLLTDGVAANLSKTLQLHQNLTISPTGDILPAFQYSGKIPNSVPPAERKPNAIRVAGLKQEIKNQAQIQPAVQKHKRLEVQLKCRCRVKARLPIVVASRMYFSPGFGRKETQPKAQLRALPRMGLVDRNRQPYEMYLTNLRWEIPEISRPPSATIMPIRVADMYVRNDGRGTVEFELDGADADHFEVIGQSLYLRAGTTLDYETKKTYDVSVTAYDPDVDGLGLTADFTLSVTDMNDPLTAVRLYNERSSVPESDYLFAFIRLADITIDDDDFGYYWATVTGPDAWYFLVWYGALYLRPGIRLNVDEKPTYNVTINVQDMNLPWSPPKSVNYSFTVIRIKVPLNQKHQIKLSLVCNATVKAPLTGPQGQMTTITKKNKLRVVRLEHPDNKNLNFGAEELKKFIWRFTVTPEDAAACSCNGVHIGVYTLRECKWGVNQSLPVLLLAPDGASLYPQFGANGEYRVVMVKNLLYDIYPPATFVRTEIQGSISPQVFYRDINQTEIMRVAIVHEDCGGSFFLLAAECA